MHNGFPFPKNWRDQTLIWPQDTLNKHGSLLLGAADTPFQAKLEFHREGPRVAIIPIIAQDALVEVDAFARIRIAFALQRGLSPSRRG
jgi:hypothetical protein